MEGKKRKYKTKQRELILSFLRSTNGKHVTAETVTEGLRGQVGLTTVYRNLDELTKDGVVLKYEAPGGLGACYRYIEDSECETDVYHFMCTGCGEMQHLYCEHFGELSRHVSKEHGLSLDSKRTVLYGSCENCKS